MRAPHALVCWCILHSFVRRSVQGLSCDGKEELPSKTHPVKAPPVEASPVEAPPVESPPVGLVEPDRRSPT